MVLENGLIEFSKKYSFLCINQKISKNKYNFLL